MTTSQLHDICRDCIEQHIDWQKLQTTKQIEALERSTLLDVLSSFEQSWGKRDGD